MNKDGGPAFPREDYQTNCAPGQQGMSLRDWFAGMSLVHPYVQGDDTYMNCKKAAAWAYELADAMIAERDKEA